MHVSPEYFKGALPGPLAAMQSQPPPDLARQVLAWMPQSLTVGDVRRLLDDAKQAASRIRPPPAAVAGRLRMIAGVVARLKAGDGAALSPEATASLGRAIAQLWQELDAAARRTRTAISIAKTRAILAEAQKQIGLDAAAPEEKKGLPGWAWLLIGAGGAGLIALILYLLLRKKPELADAEDDPPIEALPAP